MMSISLKHISLEEFIDLDCEVLFHDLKTARRFGVIINEVIMYKFSWQSDLIEPVIIINENNISCLGVDQMFTIIDFNEKIIKVLLQLDYFLYDIRFIGREIWVITELEILRFNLINYNISNTIPLSSFFKNIILTGSGVIVNCLEGEVIQVDIT